MSSIPWMPDLPIYEIEEEIARLLAAKGRLILQAPTGSGKSTQVPQMLLRHGLLDDGQVVILQPRRLAARLLAARVAQEQNTPLGQGVGYQIRLDHRAGPDTRIKYVTEGVLLRQMIQDPHLRGVRVLIFDEFHERHLFGDITLARALDLQETARPDLRIVVMSATLQAQMLEQYLDPCVVLTSEGRVFPVEIEYATHRADPRSHPVWEQAADAFASFVHTGGQGDVLVFMPGSFEIQQTLEAIRHRPESKGYLLLPLHGELSPRDQDAAVARYAQPKVVVSTNVAETSLTIDGVRLVIDSGLARIPRYDPNRGINTLLVERISQDSAEQRTGRAGRTAPGRCHRLWTRQEHAERPAHDLPEIKRLDLCEVVLTLKAAGVADLRNFRWLEPPSPTALRHAEELLTDLGALRSAAAAAASPEKPMPAVNEAESASVAPKPAGVETTGSVITDLGRKMLAFPVHPRYARMLLAAQDQGCVYQAALIAALTQGRDLMIRNPSKEVKEFREMLFGEQAGSDFWILMRAWTYAAKSDFRLEACRRAGVHAQTARQVGPLHQQFLDIAQQEGLNTAPRQVPDEALQKCVLTGFSDRVARRLDEGTLRCELVHGRRGVLARESTVQHAPLLVAAEVREIEGAEGALNTLLSLATAIQPEWLRELFPEDFSNSIQVSYDPTARRVCAEEQVRFRELALGSRRIDPPPADAAAQILAREVVAGRLILKHWDHSVDQWICRLNFLSRCCPELELPPITPEDRHHLVEQICHGAVSYRDLKDREVKAVVQSWLSPAQQKLLDRHAPERLTLDNQRKPKLVYGEEGNPYLALRIQELYDVPATPRVAMNRVAVVVHILAPSMRPVQITQDLAGFWREHYPRVKSELQRKYPRHEWR